MTVEIISINHLENYAAELGFELAVLESAIRRATDYAKQSDIHTYIQTYIHTFGHVHPAKIQISLSIRAV